MSNDNAADKRKEPIMKNTQTNAVTMDQIMPHTDLGNVVLSRAGLRAFNAARDTRACTEYAIAAYLKAAAELAA